MGFRWIVAYVLAAATLVNGLSFSVDLAPTQKKCYSDHVGKGVLVVASATSEDGTTPIGMTVSDSASTVYAHQGMPELQTAFTSGHAGPHHLCVENKSEGLALVNVVLAWGPEARDYSQVAKKEHLDSVITILRKTEDQMREYHKDLMYMRSRESRLKKATDTTAFRIAAFGLLNIGMIVVCACVQGYYFRRFFRSKKII